MARIWTRGGTSTWIKASPKAARLARKLPGGLITGTRSQPAYRSRIIINSRKVTQVVGRLRRR